MRTIKVIYYPGILLEAGDNVAIYKCIKNKFIEFKVFIRKCHLF